MTTSERRSLWSRILIVFGSIAMLVGAIKPTAGALIILLGSLLVALGTFLGPFERNWVAYRVWVFVLITIGLGASQAAAATGWVGGTSGNPMWWGVLMLPYLIGWSMGIWGPGSPRWLLLLGVVVGLWYLGALAPAARRAAQTAEVASSALPSIIFAAIGLLTIGGCIMRMRMKVAEPQVPLGSS